MHVLLAEDTTFFQIMLTDYLEVLGYTVTLKVDGKQAFEEWKNNPANYQLVVTDHDMAVMNGCQLTKALRAAGCKIPIIMVSFSTDPEISTLLTNGALNGFIAKGAGLTPTTLAALLKKVLPK